MPTFPILYFLIPYALFVLVFVVFSLFNIYHLLRYGIYNFNLYVLSVVYLAGTIFVLGASIIILNSFDWSVLFSTETILGGADQTQYFPPL
jgi:hypothetical protein